MEVAFGVGEEAMSAFRMDTETRRHALLIAAIKGAPITPSGHVLNRRAIRRAALAALAKGGDPMRLAHERVRAYLEGR